MSTLTPTIDVASLESDPHSIWSWMREHQPVLEAPELGVHLIARHGDVEQVCKDAERFSSVVPGTPLGRTVGPNMMHSEGPDHLRERELIAPILRARVIRDSYAPLLIDRAHEILRAHPEELDAVTDFARPLAELFIERLVGFLPQEPGTLERWFRGVATGASNFERDPQKDALSTTVSRELELAIDAAFTAGERPAGSLLSLYAGPSQSVLAMVKLFIIGGLQEPRDLLGLSIVALMQHPDQLAEVLDRPMLLARVVEETARWESPVGTVNRVTTQDVSLSGVLIPQGTLVAGVLASANRDPRRWMNPDAFLLARDEGPHLAFAVGAHACIGAPAARMFVREMLACIMPRLATARLGSAPELRGYEFRGPSSVALVPAT